MATTNPNYTRYGQLAEYKILNPVVDRLGIVTCEVHVDHDGTQINFDYLSLYASPAGAVTIPCVGVRVIQGQGRHTFVYTHDGKTEGSAPDTAVCELEGTDSDQPIETHPQFLDLIKKYGKVTNADGTFAGFPQTMPGDSKTKNPLYGVESYLSIGWVWTKSFTSITLPADAYRNCGCIEQPEGADGQEPPELANVRNWIKIAPRCSWRGNIWSIQKRWQAAGREGANPDIYKPSPGN